MTIKSSNKARETSPLMIFELKKRSAVLVLRFFTVLCATFTVLPLQAHEQKTSITEILFNPNTGNVEVSHRLNLHDAEHAVQDIWGEADLISQTEHLDRLALYVRGNFFMAAHGKPLALKPVGAEIDGPYVWVYDEITIPKKRIRILTVENYILRDVWKEQANLVNLEIGEFRSSVFFAGKDEAKDIKLKKKK